MKQDVLLVAVVLAWLVLASPTGFVLAQSGGGPSASLGTGYDLTWSTVDGGGGVSSGEGYSLGGTAGQPDAGAMPGGDYTLVGGFWGGGVSGVTSRYVYLPIVLR